MAVATKAVAARTAPARIKSFGDLGFNVAFYDAKLGDVANPFHAKWKAAKDEARAEMKVDFIIGYLKGRLGIKSHDIAQSYVFRPDGTTLTRAERAKLTPQGGKRGDVERAHNAAAAKFRYWVELSGKKAKGKARESAAKVVPRGMNGPIAEFIDQFAGDNVKKQIAAAIAALQAYKAKLA